MIWNKLFIICPNYFCSVFSTILDSILLWLFLFFRLNYWLLGFLNWFIDNLLFIYQLILLSFWFNLLRLGLNLIVWIHTFWHHLILRHCLHVLLAVSVSSSFSHSFGIYHFCNLFLILNVSFPIFVKLLFVQYSLFIKKTFSKCVIFFFYSFGFSFSNTHI